MSGHNKWSTIKHKKGAADARRGKVFSKIAREITLAAQHGGDPELNPTLRAVIQKARGVNMPRDNIDSAIKKGTGENQDGKSFEELSYEGYVAGGVGVVVEALTDNKNRAAADVRFVFNRYDANMAQPGSVSRSFERKGQITLDAEGVDEDTLMMAALDAGADDMERDGDEFQVTTEPATFNDVCDALSAAGFSFTSSEITLVPTLPTPITDAGQARSLMKFIDAMEELDDVQNVHTSADIPDELLEQLGREE